LARRLPDATVAAHDPTIYVVGPGVYAAIGGPYGPNAGFVIGEDAVLAVDSFFDPDAA
jgi:hypothetical protein